MFRLETLLVSIPSWTLIIPIVIGLIRWKKHSVPQRRMVYFFLVMGGFQLAQDLALEMFTNNIPLFHPVYPVEVFFFFWIYSFAFEGSWVGKILWPVAFIFLFFSIANTIFFQNLNSIPTNAIAVGSILISLVALIYFWFLLIKYPIRKVNRSSMFWLSCGLLLFFPASTLVLYYGNVIHQTLDHIPLVKTWGIQTTLLVILYLFYSIAVVFKEEQENLKNMLKV